MYACCAIANVLAHAPVIDGVVVISSKSSTGELPASTAFTTMRMRSEVLPVRGVRVGHSRSKSSPAESTVHILQAPDFFHVKWVGVSYYSGPALHCWLRELFLPKVITLWLCG